MIKTLLSALVLSGLFIGSSFAQTFGPLVKAEELAVKRSSVNAIILDIRGDYEKEHILGAVSAPYALFRGPKSNPGGLFDVTKLEQDLERIGLEKNAPIVVVSAGKTSTDFGAAARVYWTLKSTGFSDISILNGGHQAWAEANLPLSNTATTFEPSELSLKMDKTWLATTEDISRIVNGKETAVLVDSRFEIFYEGEKAHPAAARPGTIPGSINHSFAHFFKKDEAAISPIEDSSALLSQLNLEPGDDVVSFCNTGHWAASHWFALSELAGVQNARLYAGSVVEYSQADLPMENTPGYLKNLLKQITS